MIGVPCIWLSQELDANPAAWEEETTAARAIETLYANFA